MAQAVHRFERTTSRVTATDTNFVTAVTLSAAELASSGFANNDEVIVFVWALLANAGTSETSMRVTYNGSVITNANTPRIDFGAAAIERNIEWMGRLDLATLADLDVDVASSSTTDGYMERCTVAVIRLADFGTEGTDWVWNKSTTNVANTTTYSATNRAAVTIPASSGTQDWVIWGYIHGAMDSDTVNFEARMMVDGALQAGDFSEEAESTTEEKTWLMNTVESLSSATHSVTIESRDDTTTAANDHRESAIFAFRKNVWTDIFYHIPGTVSMANASDVQVATVTDSMSVGQDVLLYGDGNINLDVISTNGFMWIRKGGSTIIEPVIDDGSGLSNVRSFDATDEPNMSILAYDTASSGAQDYDLFAHHTGGSTENLLQTSFLVWGMNLPAVATAPELQVSGLVIELTYVVAEVTTQVIPVGVASEAGTAQAVGADKPIFVDVGAASEAGSALAVGADKMPDVGAATEVGSAQLVDPFKMADVVVATEVGSAQAVGGDKAADIGAASEVGSAQLVDPVKAADVGVASEVGSAQAVVSLKPISQDVSVASEVGAAQAVGASKPIVEDVVVATEVGSAQDVSALKPIVEGVGVASEVETAEEAFALKPQFIDVGSSSEVGSAHDVVPASFVPVVQATEVGSAQLVDPLKAVDVGAASESELARAVATLKPIFADVGVATEVGTAQEVDPVKAIFQAVVAALETETAQLVDPVKVILTDVVAASEAGTAQAVEASKRGAVGVATEEGAAFPVGSNQPVFVAITGATEAESAQAVLAMKPISVEVVAASEAETAQEVDVDILRVIVVGQVVEVGSAHPVSALKPIFVDVGAAAEVESAGVADYVRSIQVALASEVESVFSVDPVKPIVVLLPAILETETAWPVGTLIIGEVIVGVAQVYDVWEGPLIVGAAFSPDVVEVVPGGGVSFKPIVVVKEN